MLVSAIDAAIRGAIKYAAGGAVLDARATNVDGASNWQTVVIFIDLIGYIRMLELPLDRPTVVPKGSANSEQVEQRRTDQTTQNNRCDWVQDFSASADEQDGDYSGEKHFDSYRIDGFGPP